jgi:hypothetical protein
VPDRDDVLLDLSEWPAPPPGEPPVRRPGLPARPVPGRRVLPWGRLAAAAAVLGAGLLGAPLGGCPAAAVVWGSTPIPRPSVKAPALDDSLVASDQTSVAVAQRELSAYDRAVAEARRALRVTPVPTTRTVGGPDPTLSAALRRDEQELAAAQAALDDLVEQQQGSDDPGSYDDDIAAAQEDVDLAQARLAGDQQALAESRRVVVSTAPPAPVSESARTTVQQAPAVRASLESALTEARRSQARHLAERRKALSDWAHTRAARLAAVDAANRRLSSCEKTTGPLGAAGVALLAVAGGLLLLLRRQASAASRA